jgi:hypothetical protein
MTSAGGSAQQGGLHVKGGAAALIGDARAVRTGEGSAGRHRYDGRHAAGARTYGGVRSVNTKIW